jgi:integration host factor subunit alpha
MTLSRKELAAILVEKALFPASKSAKFVDLFFEAMVEALDRGEKIKIPGFGNFTARGKRARKGRNPKTGERTALSLMPPSSFSRPAAKIGITMD